MQVVANGIRIVAKNMGRYKSGDMYYRLQMSNGEGGLMAANVDEQTYNHIKVFDSTYSMVFNIDTNGYTHYVDVVQVSEE